jgi:hypothetical protein
MHQNSRYHNDNDANKTNNNKPHVNPHPD